MLGRRVAEAVASRSELSRSKIVSHLTRLSAAREAAAFEPVAVEVHSPTPASSKGAKGGRVASGERRARRTESHFVATAPWAARAHDAGRAAELGRGLEQLHAAVKRGSSILEVVAAGTSPAWRLRMALSNVAGEPIANWDRRSGRTRGERLELLERALVELGTWSNRKGGWQVSR